MKLIGLISLTLLSPVIIAEDKQYAAGREKAEVCMVCHGVNGVSSTTTYPNLQGQHQAYMIAALKAYRERRRTGGLALLMQQQVDLLSDQDIEDITYYFSNVPKAKGEGE